MTEKELPSAESKKPQRRDPWHLIFDSQASFLNELECIGEMLSLVLPVLKSKDEERHSRIKEMAEEVSTEEGRELRAKSAQYIRELLGHIQKMQQGDLMFRRGMVTTIVANFDKFLMDVLKVCYQSNPGWLKNPDKKISYKELLEIESLDSLKSEIIQKEIDKLTRDSHHSQVVFLDSKLKLGIEQEFPGWSDFLEITERRNLFVHTGGTVSPQYLDNCHRWSISVDEKVNEGIHLSASDTYIQRALDCFYEISVWLAQAVARRLFSDCFKDADQALNIPTVDLLSEERWDLAERIFKFALNIPEAVTSKGEMKFYFLINQCIARKFSGKPVEELLHSVDWTPFHPKYHLAVAVLEDRFDDAKQLMLNQAVQDAVTEREFKEWPLFREFRETEIFSSAFSDIYKKDFNEELLAEAEKEIKVQQDAGADGEVDPSQL